MEYVFYSYHQGLAGYFRISCPSKMYTLLLLFRLCEVLIVGKPRSYFKN